MQEDKKQRDAAHASGADGKGSKPSQRVCLMADATVDLPEAVLAHPNVKVLPLRIRLGKHAIRYACEAEVSAKIRAILHEHPDLEDIETGAMPYEQVEQFFMDELALQYDVALALIVTPSRSKILESAMHASEHLVTNAYVKRLQNGIKQPFLLEIYNSQNVYTGQGIQILALLRHLERGEPYDLLRIRAPLLAQNAYTYAVPKTLGNLYKRARAKGDKSVTLTSYAIGSALQIRPIIQANRDHTGPVARARGFENACARVIRTAIAQIKKGLYEPIILIGLDGGDIAARLLPGFDELEAVAAKAGVKIEYTIPGSSAWINVGAGSFFLGMIAHPHLMAD